MLDHQNFFKDVKKIDITNIFLISILPLSLVTRSLFINILTLLVATIFLITIVREKKLFFLNDKIFYLLCLFWLSLIINLFFSTDLKASIPRVLGFGKFIVFVFAIKYYFLLQNSKYKKFIFTIWFFTFLVISFDLLFEFIFGFNTLGYKSPWHGRLSGFLNDELKIGYYYSAFILFSLTYIYYNHKNYLLIFLCAFTFIFISFAIGERANFIKTFLIFIIFYFIFDKKFVIRKFFFLLFFFIVIIFVSLKIDGIKVRFWGQFLKPITNTLSLQEYINTTQYGAHYDTAIKIFYNYPLFGSGIKTFRNESSKDSYKSYNSLMDQKRWATHPHQIHFEFLSETGIFGYLAFLIFFLYTIGRSIKYYIASNNLYQLSSILFISITLLPILPSGSFFTTYGATIFWINFAMMIAHKNKN
jgi:O-antigen ligase